VESKFDICGEKQWNFRLKNDRDETSHANGWHW